MPSNSKSTIFDSILISSCIFGSSYVFSNSLKIIDNTFAKTQPVAVVDASKWLACVISGSIFVYGILRYHERINERPEE